MSTDITFTYNGFNAFVASDVTKTDMASVPMASHAKVSGVVHKNATSYLHFAKQGDAGARHPLADKVHKRAIMKRPSGHRLC